MILVMPTLQGSKVRTRAAARGWDLAQLAAVTGIPHGTLRNATRDRKPQGLSLTRVYGVARALRDGDDPLDQVVAEITAGKDDDGVPSTPPPPKKPPKKEPRRKNDPKGPRRPDGTAELRAS